MELHLQVVALLVLTEQPIQVVVAAQVLAQVDLLVKTAVLV
jgi:hypothetical protein